MFFFSFLFSFFLFSFFPYFIPINHYIYIIFVIIYINLLLLPFIITKVRFYCYYNDYYSQFIYPLVCTKNNTHNIKYSSINPSYLNLIKYLKNNTKLNINHIFIYLIYINIIIINDKKIKIYFISILITKY